MSGFNSCLSQTVGPETRQRNISRCLHFWSWYVIQVIQLNYIRFLGSHRIDLKREEIKRKVQLQ